MGNKKSLFGWFGHAPVEIGLKERFCGTRVPERDRRVKRGGINADLSVRFLLLYNAGCGCIIRLYGA